MQLNGIENIFFTPDFGGIHKNMNDKNEIVYSLNIEDIQAVAVQEFDRELTEGEVDKIRDLIGEKINWYDAIYYSICEKISLEDNEKN